MNRWVFFTSISIPTLPRVLSFSFPLGSVAVSHLEFSDLACDSHCHGTPLDTEVNCSSTVNDVQKWKIEKCKTCQPSEPVDALCCVAFPCNIHRIFHRNFHSVTRLRASVVYSAARRLATINYRRSSRGNYFLHLYFSETTFIVFRQVGWVIQCIALTA